MKFSTKTQLYLYFFVIQYFSICLFSVQTFKYWCSRTWQTDLVHIAT